MNYSNKKELRDWLIEYQEISEDLDDSWLENYKKFPRRPLTDEELENFKRVRDEFKSYRYKQYNDKRERFKNESTKERDIRLKRARKLQELIAGDFIKIVNGALLLNEFQNNYYYEMLKDDMTSDAIFTMYNYINKYDIRRPNPFSYFTEMAKNAFRQVRDDYNNKSKKIVNSEFLENLDDDNKEDSFYE